MPAVSVICTAKNAVRTIEATIDSICAQTFRDWEMIVIDDGSTDDTAARVHAAADGDQRIRLVTPGGIGRGLALNMAVDLASADLIANIDADDVSHPDRLRLQVEAMERHPEFAMICTKRLLLADYAAPIWPQTSSSEAAVTDVTVNLMGTNPIDHSSVMIRQQWLRAAAGYSTTRTMQIDRELWLRLAEEGCRIGRLEKVLTAKRLHAAQSFENRRRLRYVLSSAGLQLRAIRTLKGGNKAKALAMLPVRLAWNLLPGGIRQAVKLEHLRAAARAAATGMGNSIRSLRRSPM